MKKLRIKFLKTFEFFKISEWNYMKRIKYPFIDWGKNKKIIKETLKIDHQFQIFL